MWRNALFIDSKFSCFSCSAWLHENISPFIVSPRDIFLTCEHLKVNCLYQEGQTSHFYPGLFFGAERKNKMDGSVPSFRSFSNHSLSYVKRPLPSVPRRSSSIYSEEEDIIDFYLNPSVSEEPPELDKSSTQSSMRNPSAGYLQQKSDVGMYMHVDASSAYGRNKGEGCSYVASPRQSVPRRSPRISAVRQATNSERNLNGGSLNKSDLKGKRPLLDQHIPSASLSLRLSANSAEEVASVTSTKDQKPKTTFVPNASKTIRSYSFSDEHKESSKPHDQGSFFESDSEDDEGSASLRSSIMSRLRRGSPKTEQRKSDTTSESKQRFKFIPSPRRSSGNDYQGVVWPSARERREAIRKGHYIIYPSYSSTSLAPPSISELKAQRYGSKVNDNRQDSKDSHAKTDMLSAVYASSQYIGGVLASAGKGILKSKDERRREQLKKSIKFIGNPNLSVSNTVYYRG
ncbi:hypothetical protein L228DRAFT_989 [Xylona heveae TC161]|uniref:Uncharacterized protein n=1 Tax=Xylona heveae (strain CBS 132557 / TC161) TaxID=1328760 RepID=A0A165J8S2_XYLHT|nr:hypothetical protein L228DRAFT_989 [Xylona heveae TC161]KZF25904.1 hypothetical protein L228DRAFT_989 [Xylona heveae TC161]